MHGANIAFAVRLRVLLDRGVDVASGEVWLEAPRVDGDALECTVGGYKVDLNPFW